MTDVYYANVSRFLNYRRLYKACQSGFAIIAFAVGRRRRVRVLILYFLPEKVRINTRKYVQN